MAKKRKTTDFHGTGSEFLEHLETEEKRSRMLAEYEDDPVKKKQHQIKNRQIRRMIQWVKRTMTGAVETADKRYDQF